MAKKRQTPLISLDEDWQEEDDHGLALGNEITDQNGQAIGWQSLAGPLKPNLGLDFAQAYRQLHPKHQVFLRRLAVLSMHEIVALSCKSTYYRTIYEIRAQFRKQGLHRYLGPIHKHQPSRDDELLCG